MKYTDIQRPRIADETKDFILLEMTPLEFGGLPYCFEDMQELHDNGFEIACGNVNQSTVQYALRKKIGCNRDWLERQLWNGTYSEAKQ